MCGFFITVCRPIKGVHKAVGSIAYGIGIATLLTLIILPLLLSVTNEVKAKTSWLITGKEKERGAYERAIKEQKEEQEWAASKKEAQIYKEEHPEDEA